MIYEQIEQAFYMAHGFCLLWNPWLIAAHALSDLLIFASYFAIPIAIWIFIRKRPDVELKSLAILFAAFIFLCGLTHLIQFITLWWPIYETQGYVKIATAAVSIATAVIMFPLIPKAVAIPSPAELKRVNDGLAREIISHRDTLTELQRARDGLERRVAERTKELAASKARIEALVRASAQVVWTTDAEGNVVEDLASWRAFTGQSRDEPLGNGWLNALHPDDRERTAAIWAHCVKTRQLYTTEYRLHRANGEWRWTAVTGVPLLDETGAIVEWVGMNSDITDKRRAEQHAQLIMRELSHRTKNLLAVVSAMARLTLHDSASTAQFVEDFGARLQGLSRSHDLLVEADWRGASLHDLVRSQLEAFTTLDEDRASISGPPLLLRPEATQAIGLALHELATNAAKHGALRRPGGRIELTWEIEQGEPDASLVLSWREKFERVPAQLAEPVRDGFGSTVLRTLLPQSLSGSVRYELGKHGVVWELAAPLKEVKSPLSSIS